ncbi:allantoate deiminase 2 [Tanacetum coccineum]
MRSSMGFVCDFEAKVENEIALVYIEQGPVRKSMDLPLAVVKGIAGLTRIKLTIRGSQGYAGTVPMSMRQDPIVVATELIVSLEILFCLASSSKDFASFDVLGFGKAKENQFPVLSRMAMDILSVQASSVASVIRIFIQVIEVVGRCLYCRGATNDATQLTDLRYCVDASSDGSSGVVLTPEVNSFAPGEQTVLSHEDVALLVSFCFHIVPVEINLNQKC